MKKKIVIIVLSLFAFVSCGASNMAMKEAHQANDYAEDVRPTEEYKGEAEIAEDEATSEENIGESSEEDYIERFVYLELETIDYEKDLQAIKDSAKNLEGQIENESTYLNNWSNDRELRNTELAIKIPRDNTDKFDQTLESLGKTISKSQNSNNLKNSFRDVDKELEIKEKQLAKFNELLDQTNNIEDTLVINSKIIETQGEIDAIKKAKADLKDRVTYDTYNITLREVFSFDNRANNPDLGTRIKEAMGESLGIVKEFFAQVIVGFFLYWPFILIILVIVFVIIRIRKKKNKVK